MAALIRECTDKCNSRHHVDLCVSALTKCSDDQFKLLTPLCTNSLTLPSTDGRTCLHLAASLGKTELVQWILEQNGECMSISDLESGWNALHRALFYGHLTTARLLITEDPRFLLSMDSEGRAPLDVVVADRRHQPSSGPRNELYCWGENVNFTLGQASEQVRLNPEVVQLNDVTGVDDVVMCKYHTLILTTNGKVLSCGHGWGGRLGHGSEATVLTPKMISTLKNENVLSVAAARDHSVFLTEHNSVFSCGLNEHRQLGLEAEKVLQPKVVKHKLFKEHELRGVCAGRFHTVVWASDALFTFGLNAGQLGHHQGETYQIQPRLVSGIQYKTSSLERVVCSDAAILCFTKQGELILINEFRIRKIAANWTLEKILISGGKLDHRNDLDVLKELGGCEISIGVMNPNQQIFMWRQSDPTLRRVNFCGHPWLSPKDFAISKNCLMISSTNGQVFTAKLPAERKRVGGKKRRDSLSQDFGSISLNDLCKLDETCYVDLKRVRGIHRATSVFMDGKSENFMTIQCLPNENLFLVPEASGSGMLAHIRQLYTETTADDVIHDVILESKNLHLPAHQFILSSGCTYFQSLFRGENAGELLKVDVSELGNADIIVQMVQFMYTGTCDLMTAGTKFKFTLQPIDPSAIVQTSKERNTKGKSAYSVYKSGNSNAESGQVTKFDVNPVRLLKEMAKSLVVKGLLEKLDNIAWQDGKVCLKDKSRKMRDVVPILNRRKMSHLFDVKLESDDGQVFNCHKCVLTARMEYFHSMLTCGWRETGQSANITLPVIGPVFHVILQYLYTDDSSDLRASTDVEFMCNVLVAADQLLVTRLKEICEVVICQHLTLKNVAEVVEFASVYNAQQLKTACFQFICLNLTALLEARSLDVVNDEVMDEVSEFYRESIPAMRKRQITPYDQPPSVEDLETLASAPVEVEESKSDSSVVRRSKRRRSSKSDSKRNSFSDAVTSDASPDVSFNLADMTFEPIDSPEPMEAKSPLWLNSPEDSPVADMAKSPTWPMTSPNTTWSMTSPNTTWPPVTSGYSDVLGLKDIMAEEVSHSRDINADRGALGGRKKKLSQKERKRLALEVEKSSSEENVVSKGAPSGVPSTGTPWGAQASTSTVCPWAQGATASTPAQSFRDLMLDEESESKSQTSQKMKIKTPMKPGSKSNITWGLPQRGRADASKIESAKSDVAISEPTNPWTTLSVDINTSFNEIVEEEISEKVTLDKTRRKPLHLIQQEEQAISELMEFYKKNNAVDVKISVERVTKTAAKPTWAAKQ